MFDLSYRGDLCRSGSAPMSKPPRTTRGETVRAVPAILSVLLVMPLTACDDEAPSTSDPVTTTTRVVEGTPAATQPPRPAGSVPRPVLGIWHGGQDNRTDYTFIVVSAGEYELDHAGTPALPAFVEKGWIVGDATRILLRPVLVDGVRTRERVATWNKLPNSVGIDILVISDPLFGELTYVPADR
jgi:hypothetical protein